MLYLRTPVFAVGVTIAGATTLLRRWDRGEGRHYTFKPDNARSLLQNTWPRIADSVEVATGSLEKWCSSAKHSIQAGIDHVMATVALQFNCKAEEQLAKLRVEELDGVWVKDQTRSTSMDPFLHLFGGGLLLRQASRLLRGLSISVKGARLEVRTLTAVPFVSVLEVYDLGGGVTRNRRRDLKGGLSEAQVEVFEDCLRLKIHWHAPQAGWAVDELRLSPSGDLHVHCIAGLDKGTAEFTAVYRRKD